MARPPWTPTDTDRAALAAIAAAATEADAAEDWLWALARAARAAGIPIGAIGAATRRGRSTVYRRLEELEQEADDETGGAPAAAR